MFSFWPKKNISKFYQMGPWPIYTINTVPNMPILQETENSMISKFICNLKEMR